MRSVALVIVSLPVLLPGLYLIISLTGKSMKRLLIKWKKQKRKCKMDKQLLVPIKLTMAVVLKEAKEKYPYLTESVALAEYHELQRLIEKHLSVKAEVNNDVESKAKAMVAHQKKMIAANLYELFAIRIN